MKFKQATLSVIESIKSRNFTPSRFFGAVAAGFCAASFFSVAKNGNFQNLDFISKVSVFGFCTTIVVIAAILCALSILTKSALIQNAALYVFAVFFACSLGTVFGKNSYALTGVAIVLLIVLKYIYSQSKDIETEKLPFSYRTAFIGVCIIFAAFTVYVSVYTSFAYRNYSTTTFDFGIFAQMFEQMCKTGLPVTTIERQGLTSHFAVHFSPIYYLLLPGYAIMRTPIYLYIIQAACVGAGIFAVYKICRELKFSPVTTLICSAVYAFYPTMAYGCFYDFHENKFLSVLILWCIYFFLRKSYIPAFVFALLTLMVKEDAVIYVATIALWLIISKRERLRGSALLVFSFLYFLFAVKMISVLGGEPMTSRFSNYFPPNAKPGFLTLAKTVILDFGYFIGQVFTADKFTFLLFIFVPICFTVFLGKSASTIVLCLPIIIENLMSNWIYQYDIYFQYTYGSAALVIFAMLLSVSEMSSQRRRQCIIASFTICLVFAVSLVSPLAKGRADYHEAYKAQYADVNNLLNEYKDEFKKHSVSADAYIIPHLYYVSELISYPRYYGGDMAYTDYYVVDTRHTGTEAHNPYAFMLGKYELIEKAGFIEIYRFIGIDQ